MMRGISTILAVIFAGGFLYDDDTPFAWAQVMQSPNYQIQSDSLNVGGGLSTSSSYSIESTAGEIATGPSDSSSYSLRAGYQQMQEVFISIAGASNVVMSPSIPGLSGGTSNGSTTVTVTTDSPSGYQLTIAASNDPAMQKGADTIADYAPGGDPSFAFTTASGDAHFGYTPEGAHVVQRFLDNGSDTCNTGSTDTSLACWDGLTTSEVAVAQDTNPNHPDGATTTVNFRVGIGSSAAQAPGTYTATTTLTALPL